VVERDGGRVGTSMSVRGGYVGERMCETAGRAYRDRVVITGMREWVRRSPWAGDVTVALLVTLFAVLVSAQLGPERHARALDATGYGLVVAAGLSLVWARRYPWAVVAFSGAVFVAYVLDNYAGGPVFATVLVGLFWLGDRAPRRLTVVTGAAVSAVVVAAGLLAGRDEPLMYLVVVGWAGAAVLLGEMAGARREQMAAMVSHARELERTREAEAAQRVAEERLRIARDLHDSVAHSMAIINV
jgi:signal transduction histidine kinase